MALALERNLIPYFGLLVDLAFFGLLRENLYLNDLFGESAFSRSARILLILRGKRVDHIVELSFCDLVVADGQDHLIGIRGRRRRS